MLKYCEGTTTMVMMHALRRARSDPRRRFVKRAGAHVAVLRHGGAVQAELRPELVGATVPHPDHGRELRVLRVEEGAFRGGPDLVVDRGEPIYILGLRG